MGGRDRVRANTCVRYACVCVCMPRRAQRTDRPALLATVEKYVCVCVVFQESARENSEPLYYHTHVTHTIN